ncbi:FHA domain-containing protein [bacterium]|nr:FHA domain-containing protein [bacterium]
MQFGQAQTPGLEISSLDASRYPEVELFVTDPSGGTLDLTTLEVFENGSQIPPENVTATTERAGVAVAVVIDLSRSMRGVGMPGSFNRLEDVRELTAAIGGVLDIQTDLFALYTFNRGTQTILELSPADGGGIQNLLIVDERLQAIPDKPGGRFSEPTAEDYINDDYAYAALSKGIQVALNDLVSPSSTDSELRQRLARMHKVVVVFSDSCDDALTAFNSFNCDTIPADLSSVLKLVAEQGRTTIFGVGVGPTDSLGLLVDPEQLETGYGYEAQHLLLEKITDQIRFGNFITYFTRDPEAAAQVRQTFDEQVLTPIQERAQQVRVVYRAPTITGQINHSVEVRIDDRAAVASYEEPPIDPRVQLQSRTRSEDIRIERFPLIELDIEYAQTSLVRVEYFINDETEPIIVNTGDLSFDTQAQDLVPGSYTIEAQVTDSRGLTSRSDQLSFDIPPPSTAETLIQVGDYILNNAIIIAIGLIVIILLSTMMLTRPGRQVAVQMQQGATRLISAGGGDNQRLTRIFTPSVIGSPHILIVREGTSIGKEYIVSSNHMYLGADSGAVDIYIDDDFVSRQHASIQLEGEQLYIVDEDSSNGVYVNGQRVPPRQRVPIVAHSKIKIGGTTLEYVLRPSPDGGAGGGHSATELDPSRNAGRTVTYEKDRHGK